MEKTGKADTVGNLETSAQSGKPRTAKTSKLTPAEALEILQAALVEYQRAGGKVEIVPDFYSAGVRYTGILLAQVRFTGTDLVPLMAQE